MDRISAPATIRRLPVAALAGMAMLLPCTAWTGSLGKTLPASTAASAAATRVADFGKTWASPDARQIADWVAKSGDNEGDGFIIVDKKYARIYVFDSSARLRGDSPVLLGGARGDESIPDIGKRPLRSVRPEERTTPAGRFLAERGRDVRGEDVVWVDYDAAVSMHRVVTTNPKERRLERLATPTVSDNRISYGCINVPVPFYENQVRPMFAKRRIMVYVLPEIKPLREVFAAQLEQVKK